MKMSYSRFKELWYKYVPTYRRTELRCVDYDTGGRLILNSVGKPENEQWVIASEEDDNKVIGMVYLERRERIVG